MRRTLLALALLAGLCCGSAGAAYADENASGSALVKLTRGAVNTITGWVEIPKRVHETTEASGWGTGLTWGLLRGFGYGFVRTAAGLYEVVTFPFPAPPDYESVIQPEYVFTDEPEVTDNHY